MSLSPITNATRQSAADRFAQVRLTGETLACSDSGQPPKLTICVPTFKDDASQLIAALSVIEGAGAAEIVIYDDGSGDGMLLASVKEALKTYPGQFMLVSNEINQGRSTVRNRLAAFAGSEWLLFLDADMRPDSAFFLTNYLDALSASPSPSLIVGGFSMQQVRRRKSNRLHHAQSVASDCLSAERRRSNPGRFVYTSNLLVHRSILESVPFDEGFEGWGWEDVDWGLRVANAYPVTHIDNTASHLGLYSNAALIRRFGESGANYARLRTKHPEATAQLPLTRAIRMVNRLPGKRFLRASTRFIAEDRMGMIPLSIRLIALKAYRAVCYAADETASLDT